MKKKKKKKKKKEALEIELIGLATAWRRLGNPSNSNLSFILAEI